MNRLTLAIVIFLANSGPLVACAVCGVGKEESRNAYVITTAILTVVPLIMIGFIVNYIYRQVKIRAAAEEQISP